MSTVYPTGIDTFVDVIDGVTVVSAKYVNNLQDSMSAIETFLGTMSSGTFSDYKYMTETIPVTGTISNNFLNVTLSQTPTAAPTMTLIWATGNASTIPQSWNGIASNPCYNYTPASGVVYGSISSNGYLISGNSIAINSYPSVANSYPWSTNWNYAGSLAVDTTGTNIYYAYSSTIYATSVNRINTFQTQIANATGVGFGGDGGSANSAGYNNIKGVYVDSSNNCYLCDTGNFRVRKITNGIVNTFAGNGTIPTGLRVDGVPATGVGISPSWVSGDDRGNIYISDGNVLRMVDASGIIHNIMNPSGIQSYTGDGGLSNFATCGVLGTPFPLKSGQGVLVPDTTYSTIRLINATGLVTTMVGSPGVGGNVQGTNPTGLSINGPCLNTPQAIATDGYNYFVQSYGGTLLTGLTYFSVNNPTTAYWLNPSKGFSTEYVNSPVLFNNSYVSIVPSGATATENTGDPNCVVSNNLVTQTNGGNTILGYFTGTSTVTIFFRTSAMTSMANGTTKPYAVSASYFYRG